MCHLESTGSPLYGKQTSKCAYVVFDSFAFVLEYGQQILHLVVTYTMSHKGSEERITPSLRVSHVILLALQTCAVGLSQEKDRNNFTNANALIRYYIGTYKQNI